MAQERSGENQEKTKASRGILATDGSGGSAAHMAAAAAGRRGTTPPCTYTLIQNSKSYLEILVVNLGLVSKELKQLAAILHVYAGV